MNAIDVGADAGGRVFITLVSEVTRVVGRRPILVLGSRALGTASPDSDLDAYVVLPTWSLPLALRRLSTAQQALERQLGIPVSLNPISRWRLRVTRGAMLPFKLQREGLVAWAPDGWALADTPLAPDDTAARRSYAMSGILFLLAAATPVVAGAARLDADAEHFTAKAALHAAQLELARTGRWRSTLNAAAEALGGVWVVRSTDLASPETWLAVRDELVVSAAAHTESRTEAVVRGLQWAALRIVRGERALPTVRCPSPAAALTVSAIELVAALERGRVRDAGVARAHAALPPSLRRTTRLEWFAVRDAISRDWPNASPLAGV